MLMLNITQKRLIDDWLIDKSLPSRLYCYNEEDVDCKSKPYNCCFFLRSAFLAITKLCFQGFTGQKQLFSAVQTIYQRTVNNISYKEQKATYYIMSLLLLWAKATEVSATTRKLWTRSRRKLSNLLRPLFNLWMLLSSLSQATSIARARSPRSTRLIKRIARPSRDRTGGLTENQTVLDCVCWWKRCKFVL